MQASECPFEDDVRFDIALQATMILVYARSVFRNQLSCWASFPMSRRLTVASHMWFVRWHSLRSRDLSAAGAATMFQASHDRDSNVSGTI
jgi:hypothetical protein